MIVPRLEVHNETVVVRAEFQILLCVDHSENKQTVRQPHTIEIRLKKAPQNRSAFLFANISAHNVLGSGLN